MQLTDNTNTRKTKHDNKKNKKYIQHYDKR